MCIIFEKELSYGILSYLDQHKLPLNCKDPDNNSLPRYQDRKTSKDGKFNKDYKRRFLKCRLNFSRRQTVKLFLKEPVYVTPRVKQLV